MENETNIENSYEEFCGQVYKESENLKSNGSIEVRLYDVLLKYWKFISNGQVLNKIKCDSPIACTNKLALFTAIGDETNMKESANISDVINSYGRIAAVGINQPLNDNLFHIGWMTYGRVLFDNYNLWPENPLEPFLNTFLCTMNVKNSGDYRKCGEAYCDEVPCSYHGTRSCYFLAGCVNGHCLYWDMLAYYRDDAQSQCQNINSTLVVVYDKTFQDGLYSKFEFKLEMVRC
uniref:C-type lectin domain-containing protein n=1 Tax=Acrobeloides nanus TaxID=290746 RepID=A0A914C642_9BILA